MSTSMAQDDKVWRGNIAAIEVRITRVHAHPAIMMEGEPNRIDPDKWRPLIMSFQQFYGLAPEKLQRSELGQIPERYYRPPGWQPAALVALPKHVLRRDQAAAGDQDRGKDNVRGRPPQSRPGSGTRSRAAAWHRTQRPARGCRRASCRCPR